MELTKRWEPWEPDVLALAVRFLRALRGWDQKGLAEASGVHKSLISLYETGGRVPSRRQLARLAEAAGLPFLLLEQLLPILRATLAVTGQRSSGPPSEDPAALAAEVARAVSDAVLVAVGELSWLGSLDSPE